jgi:calcineurin-like phosphoesterase family protein
MKTIWFTSDSHFSHTNIIRYCNRPFADVEQMNEMMISNWNAKVKHTDTVYHLGDLIFSHKKDVTVNLLRRLNGTKFIIWGNHDKHKDLIINAGFIDCGSLHEVTVPLGGNNLVQKVVLCHYPLASWNGAHHGILHLHGHCHGTLPFDKTLNRMDVGVDNFNYSPVNIEEIRVKLSQMRAI